MKPASHVQIFCTLTLFRAFNLVLTLDVLVCVLYSVFILIDEIQRSSYDIITYIELAKTIILILHGAVSSVAFKRCIILKRYGFALAVKYIKLLAILSILCLVVA